MNMWVRLPPPDSTDSGNISAAPVVSTERKRGDTTINSNRIRKVYGF